MASLPELQEAFVAAVVGRDERILAELAVGGAAGTERLAVYRHNQRHNLHAALQAVHPVVEMLVGEEFFAFASARYAAAHPSTSGDIHAYGKAFGDFLAAFAPAAGLPYLPDMARLEWAMHEVFHAPDDVPCTLAELASADVARLGFALSPACRLLHSPYPVARLWTLHQPGVAWDGNFSLDSGAAAILVRRDGQEVLLEELGRGEFALLSRLARGEALGRAFEAALGVEAAFELGAFLLRRLPALVIKT